MDAFGEAHTGQQAEDLREALKKARRVLEDSQRTAHVGSFEWDIETDEVSWSAELKRIYALERGFDGTVASFLRHVHPEDLARVQRIIDDALNGRGRLIYDHRILRDDGTVRILHTRGDVIRDPVGKPIRVCGCCWDVTDQRAAEEKVERTVSVLQATIDATADGILVVARDGRITLYNQRFTEMWSIADRFARGVDDDALLKYVTDQLTDPETFRHGVQALYDAPEKEDQDILRFKDGRVFERRSLPHRLGGEIVGRVWSFTDITARDRLLQRAVFLADASRLLATLDIERALEAVAHLAVPFLGDACAIELYEQAGARRLVTVTRGKQLTLPPSATDAVRRGEAVTETRDRLTVVALPLAAKKTTMGALLLAADPAAANGRQGIDRSAAEELAARIASAMENARLYRSLQEAIRARDEFLTIVAHEIRGPLTSLHLGAQFLERGLMSEPTRRAAAKIIQREDLRLSRFVKELMEVARIRDGATELQRELVELTSLVRTVVSNFSADLASTRTELKLEVDEEVTGEWDAHRLQQIVEHLLSNALKFGAGGPVTIGVRETEGRAELSVRDEGQGIAADLLERIFDPFERGVSVRHYGGLGLGLFITRTLVEELGGRIRVETEPGKGTTFRVELPLRRRRDDGSA